MVLGVHRFFSSNTSRQRSVTYASCYVSESNLDTISAIFNTIFILHNIRPSTILINYLPDFPVFIFFVLEELRLFLFQFRQITCPFIMMFLDVNLRFSRLRLVSLHLFRNGSIVLVFLPNIISTGLRPVSCLGVFRCSSNASN